jgi:hypothetical protein
MSESIETMIDRLTARLVSVNYRRDILFLGRDSDRQRRAYPYCTTLATHIKRDS